MENGEKLNELKNKVLFTGECMRDDMLAIIKVLTGKSEMEYNPRLNHCSFGDKHTRFLQFNFVTTVRSGV